MKPDDSNGHLPPALRLPQTGEIDYEDLGNVVGHASIQSCKACAFKPAEP